MVDEKIYSLELIYLKASISFFDDITKNAGGCYPKGAIECRSFPLHGHSLRMPIEPSVDIKINNRFSQMTLTKIK